LFKKSEWKVERKGLNHRGHGGHREEKEVEREGLREKQSG
jgi:hypothetical protein